VADCRGRDARKANSDDRGRLRADAKAGHSALTMTGHRLADHCELAFSGRRPRSIMLSGPTPKPD